MQKLGLTQSLQQKLSPQQIQFIKLLQVPTVELESRIEEELEVNPALEEGDEAPEQSEQDDFEGGEDDSPQDDLNVDDYLNQDDFGWDRMAGDGRRNEEDDREIPIVSQDSFLDVLIDQIGYLKLNEREQAIANQLVGSIESDGYIRRELEAIVNDLAFTQNIETDIDELETILYKIQQFDPPGIGARNLRECLMLQLERKEQLDEATIVAKGILDETFDEFTKKHYDKIIKKLEISEEQLKMAVDLITKLNPKPGSSSSGVSRVQYIIPDFILQNNNEDITVTLNARNAPELRVSRSYSEMLDTYNKSNTKDKKLKETVSFVKQKLDSAKWFIDAIKQRQETLLRTMNSIVKYQYDFFLNGDESSLRPMILKDIAEDIGMDISTISRVANSKSVLTEFGTLPLKYFFSESIQTDTGEDVSSREVKAALKSIIEDEDKKKPLSDDKIVVFLKEKGYPIARRTVAKYREQLKIPVARLRKEL